MVSEIALQLGGGVFSAFLQVLFDKLSSPALRHLGYFFKVEEKLKSLEWTLSKLYSLVNHAEMQILPDPGLAKWLRELKTVARDAEDVLDDFAAVAQSFYDIGKKIDDIQKRLSDIAQERRDLASAYPPPFQLRLQAREWRATSSLPTERSVLGRDGEQNNLIRMLGVPDFVPLGDDASSNGVPLGDDASPAAGFSVLPIVAMGGLGKTTLVRAVYNDRKVADFFDRRIWVYVSEDFNVRRITEEVLAAVSHERPCCCGVTSLDKLQSNLRCVLKNEKFLLVLDDLWSENRQEWERFCAPLNFAKEGSKILITTRSRKVADIIGTMDPLFLDPLPDEKCWDLFKACAFVEKSCGQHSRLEEIGKQIVRRLKGVPLAVKTIGGLLYSNTDEEAWKTILDCQLWKLSRYEDDIMPVLRLSYQQMPAHLKLCFEFCSIFPKGFRFSRHRLVPLWMAQGFVQPQVKRRIEDIGGEYFDELVCRSFFQKVDDGEFLMHDLMHELAQSVASDECVIIDGKPQIIPEKVLHSLLHLDTAFEFKDLYQHKSLRTLLFLEKKSGFNFSRVPKELFQNLKYMRALDLSHSDIAELPDSIGLLKHLRHLDLSYTRILILPNAVGELCNLQTMFLINCNLAELPGGMNRLINLRNFKGNPALLSKVVRIGDLICLQELQKFEVSTEDGRKAGELKGLNELRGRLHISKLENVMSGEEADEASLVDKQYLHTVELEWGAGRRDDGTDMQVLESLKPHPCLKTLKIRCNGGSDFPSWLANKHLPNLENVSIVKCQKWTVLPSIGELTSLKYLEIGAMTRVTNLQREFWGDSGSPSLVELTIFRMTVLASLGVDKFLSLQKLDINGCPQLTVLPALPPTLKELSISHVGLSVLPQLWGCDGASSSASSSTSSSLSSVYISDCPNLTSLQQGLLQHSHTALKTLRISNCGNLVFLPTKGFNQLICLTSLVIHNCPNLASLPERYNLPPSLESLVVQSYTHFFTNNQSLLNQFHNLTSLSTLSITTIPKLKFLSDDVLRCLSTLQILTITGCQQLETLEIGVLTAIKNLVVTCCPNLITLAGSNALPSDIPLRSITVRDCASLSSLPTGLRTLSLLEYLSIRGCPRINPLPVLPASVRIDTDITP